MGQCPKDVVAKCPRGSAVSVDERMNVVQTPKAVRGQYYRIGTIPHAVHFVDKVVHEVRHAIVRWRFMVSDCHLAPAVLSGVDMKTGDGVMIQRVDDRR